MDTWNLVQAGFWPYRVQAWTMFARPPDTANWPTRMQVESAGKNRYPCTTAQADRTLPSAHAWSEAWMFWLRRSSGPTLVTND
jgi:hypothetical protein